MSSNSSAPAPSAPNPAPAPVPALPEGYTLHPGYPPIPTYLHLRAASGLTPKTPAQAAPIAQNSWYGCYITYTPPAPPAPPASPTPPSADKTPSEEIVAMGRIIGDGGWYFHIADMAVLPSHQRRGLGGVVLAHLMARIKKHAPPGEDSVKNKGGAYVTLFADAPGRRLYERSGFVSAAPGQVGMMMPMGWERREG